MFSTMLKAFLGRICWMKTKKKYNIENSGLYVLMLPDDNYDFNIAALHHIDDFLDYRRGKGVIILTTEAWVFQNAHKFSARIINVEKISQRDYHYYYHYYYYYLYYGCCFSEQFIMMSLQGTHGNRLALTDGVRGIEKSDMACMGLYTIRNWNKNEAHANG